MKKVYNEEFFQNVQYYKYLTEEVMVKCLKERLLNIESNDFSMPYKDLIGIRAIDHYEAFKMQHDFKVEESSLPIYLKEINRELEEQPLLLLSLPIFKLPKDILRKYIPQIDQIEKAILEKKNEAQAAFEKLNHDLPLTLTEKNNLISFFTYSIPIENPSLHQAQEYLVKYLLNNGLYLKAKTMSFILKYLGHKKAQELNLDSVEILIGKLDSKQLGISLDNAIVINKDTLKKITFYDNILQNKYGDRFDGKTEGLAVLQTLYHELSHQMDAKEVKEKKVTDRSFYQATKKLVMTYYDKDEYHRNYAVQEIEKTANETGWKFVAEAIKKYLPAPDIPQILNPILKFEYKEHVQKNISSRVNKRQQFVYSSDLLTHHLDHIFKQSPSLLNEYPQFLTFYQADGSAKSTATLLSNPCSYAYNNFYLGQVIYRFKTTGLDKMEVASFSKEKKGAIIKSIANLLFTIYSKMQTTMDYIIFYERGIKSIPSKILDQIDLNFTCYQKVSSSLRTIATKMLNYFPELNDPQLQIDFYFNGKMMLNENYLKIQENWQKYQDMRLSLNNTTINDKEKPKGRG